MALGAMWGAAQSFTAPQSAPAVPAPRTSFTLQGPFTHENLAVYLVHGPTSDARDYITLDEGLTAGTVMVHEKGSGAGQDQAEVNTLEIENRSGKWLFLQAGDIVKGGKQDRTIMTDLTLAPRSGPQPLGAFCVEHGRWTPGGDGLAFSSSPGIVAGASLKRAIQSDKPDGQQRVWQEVAKTEERAVAVARGTGGGLAGHAGLSTTGTYNAIAADKTLSGNRDTYVAALLAHIRKDKKATGLAVAVNGVITSADVYASPALFQRVSAKLLNSYALEALLARDATLQSTAPDILHVMAFLSRPAAARASTQTVGQSIQRSTRETEDAVMYEYGRLNEPTKGNDAIVVLHRSYVKK